MAHFAKLNSDNVVETGSSNGNSVSFWTDIYIDDDDYDGILDTCTNLDYNNDGLNDFTGTNTAPYEITGADGDVLDSSKYVNTSSLETAIITTP